MDIETINSSADDTSALLKKRETGRVVILTSVTFIVSLVIVVIVLGVYLAKEIESTNDALCTPFDQSDKSDWLSTYAVQIDSIDISEGDTFSDLSRLNFLTDKDVVFLGETDHGDGTPSKLKGRIVSYLHQKLGFNTLAFEVGPYDALRVMEGLVNLTEVNTTSVYNTFGPNLAMNKWWAFAAETQQLFNYVAESLNTSSPLEFMGFDWAGTANFPTSFGGSDLAYDALREFLLDALPSSHMPSEIYFSLLQNVTMQKYALNAFTAPIPIPSESEIDNFFSTFDSTFSYLNENFRNDIPHYYLWVLIYNQTRALASDAFIYGPPCNHNYFTCPSLEYNLNSRDRQQANNLLYFLNARGVHSGSLVGIEKRKIIVWLHNSHAIRNLNDYADPGYQFQLENPENPLATLCKGNTPCGVFRAGHVLYDYIGPRMYSIAAIAGSGTTGSNDNKCSNKKIKDIKIPVGSIEYDLHKASFNKSAFLDFVNNPLPPWLVDYYSAAYFDYNIYGLAHITSLYDGVLFMDVAQGVTCLTDP